MARPKSSRLTDAELRLMDVVWERGKATVQEVVDALPRSLGLHYSTVLTTLRILEAKGYLRHSKEGRAFIYEAAVPREEASRDAVRHVLSRFFGNRRDLLLLNLLKDEEISPAELEQLKKMIEESKS